MKQEKKESVFDMRTSGTGFPDTHIQKTIRNSPDSIDKLKKVRRLCENCYQFRELNQADREKLMEVSMYELILVSWKPSCF